MARIQIIDDDPAVRDSLSLVLALNGHDVRTAETGQTGLALARDFRPHAILTDIIMPGGDGIETILALKAQHPGVPVIAMSGGGRTGNRDHLELARQMGADAALEKPFDEDTLLAAINARL